ncbi:MAG: MraY family glycosyltransferase, partial [Firmicutes bacterium]|nr:MraY family glycosyltransferase [Bacillota bacterium]
MSDINYPLIFGLLALVFSALISYVITPIVMLLAVKVKAIDVPKDDRRMHSRAIPRLGGLAIFIAFCSGTLIFSDINIQICGLLLGALVIVALGFVDDIFALSPWLKLLFQIIASFIPILCGNAIEHISIFGRTIEFGVFSIPVTVLWIVGLTNAVNLIDGLDGLACGIATIA